MARYLRTNTAVRLVVGPFIDKADGFTLKTGMTVTNLAMNMWHEHDDGSAPTKSIDAVAFTASGGNNDMVELAGGYYDIEITAAQVNFIGRAKFQIYDVDVVLPYFEDWVVLPAAVFDSLIAGTDNLQVDTVQVGGTTQTARDLGASVLLSSGTGTGQLDFTSGVVKSNLSQILGTALTETSGLIAAAFKKFFNVATPTGTVNSIPDAVAGASGGIAIVGSSMAVSDKTGFALTSAYDAAKTAASQTSVDTVDTVVDAIKAKTDNLPASPAAVGSAMTLAADQAVNVTKIAGAAVNTALAQVGVNVVSQANIDFGALQKTSLNNATPAVTVSDKTGFSLSAAGLLAIWHTLLADIVTASTIGKKLKDWVLGTDNKALISTDAQDLSATLDVNAKKLGGATPNNAVAAPTTAQIRTELATELGRIDAAVSTRLASASYTAPANSDITAIKAKTDNLPADPASNTQVNTRLASASYTAPPTAAAIADAVLDEVIDTGVHDTDKTAGKRLMDAAAAGTPPTVGQIRTELESGTGALLPLIKTQTDKIPASPAAVGSQMDLVNAPNATAIAAIQNGLATTTNTAAILAELDNLNDVTAAEVANAILAKLGITAGGTWTLQKALKIITAWVAGNWRVKSGSPTTQELIDPDDGTTVILEQVLSTSTPYRTITVKI